MQKFRVSGSFALASVALVLSSVLTGCGVGAIAPPTGITPLGVISGSVHGGRQPIVGAHIYLFEAGNSGYASAFRSSLLSAGSNITGFPTASDSKGFYVTTNATGGFSLNGGYTCDVGSLVYLYSEGGDPGAGVNSAAELIALLGPCPAAGNLAAVTPFINISEISTVAAAYATAGFGSGPLNIGSPDPSTNALAGADFVNAFASATNLFNVGGTAALATTPAGNGTVPVATLHTLANILASCVNSTGSGSTQCTTLFTYAATGGNTGTMPTDVTTAAFNIAHNAGNATSVAALFPLQVAQSPYQPSLVSAPNDFTVGISYTGGGLNVPNSVAIDGTGNVWVSNLSGNSLSKFSNLGAVLSGTGFVGGGLSGPAGVAIDLSGNVWVGNVANNGLAKFSNSGTALSPVIGIQGAGLADPQGVAIDASNNVWATNTNASTISKLSNSGTAISPTGGYTGGGLNHPIGIAIDASGNPWIANNTAAFSLSKFDATASGFVGSYTGGGLNAPRGVAIDASGNNWLSNDSGNAISEFSSAGVASSSSGYTGGGISSSTAVSIDGSGNIWAANAGNTVSELSNAGTALSPSTGFKGGSLSGPRGIAVDGSGNVWVTNGSGNTVTELVGAGSPVVTPLATGIATNKLGARP